MKCLEEYSEIFKKYPLNDKRFKKERNIALHSWRVDKNDYIINLNNGKTAVALIRNRCFY